MGSNKIDKTGEKNINTFGSEMIIVKYRTNKDIDVYFPKYNWTFKGTTYSNFKKGEIKCPYEPRVYGVGYVGEGEYKCRENGKDTKVYRTWYDMLRRCYDEKNLKRNPTYVNCKVSESFHNFQNFGKWYENNFYQVDDEKMCLDKDILVKHNKIYSPETCVFVPETINLLFTKRQNDRGESVIGVTYNKRDKKYATRCNLLNPETGKSKSKYLGTYETQEKAFEVYKYYKEKNIKVVADYYKNKIPNKLYNVMYNYEVETTD